MLATLQTTIAFLVAITVLVTVHEWGHYRTARACGVKVLRFSIGFGKPLWQWVSPRSGTVYMVCAIPLGGYVKMLDAREGVVAEHELAQAFGSKPLWQRAAIVAAGPVANLVLAVLLYALLNWTGVSEPIAHLAKPVENSIAAKAGLQGGEYVQSIALSTGDAASTSTSVSPSPSTSPATTATPVTSFDDLRWQLAKAAISGQDVTLAYTTSSESGAASQTVTLPLHSLGLHNVDETLYQSIGIVRPYVQVQVGTVFANSVAQQAGLRQGDTVLQVDGVAILDASQLIGMIRSTVQNTPQNTPQTTIQTQQWLVRRAGDELSLNITPKAEVVEGKTMGRIGAELGEMPTMGVVRFGLWEGLQKAVVHTADVSAMSLKMMGQMLVGNVSLKNLSGPITIATYAGRSASVGLSYFLAFLALISVSIGILNLLPLPVLDGGHLMYYLWEAVTRREVSPAWAAGLQRIGLVLLFLMMSVAIFNDIHRWFT